MNCRKSSNKIFHLTSNLLALYHVKFECLTVQFLARDSMLSALYAIARPSVRPSVRLSHGWISQKQLNVSSKFFHHLIGPTF